MALAEEPENEVYQKALQMTDRAPGLHAELQRQLAQQQQAQPAGAAAGGGAAGGGGARDGEAAAAAAAERAFYDWVGWGVLLAGAAAYALAVNTLPPPRM